MSKYLDVVLNNEDLVLPTDLFENEEIFKSVLSFRTWQNLSPNDKIHLKKFLPSFPMNNERLENDTVRLVFSNDHSFKHGNAVDVLYQKIKAGCYSPETVKQLRKSRKLKYKDYRLKEKQRYRHLLQDILISRQRILDQLARHGPGQSIRPYRPEVNSASTSFDDRVRKKYQKIIKEVKTECQDNSVSSDEEDDSPIIHENAGFPLLSSMFAAGPPPPSRHPMTSSLYKSPASQSMDVSDHSYRGMLESHRKRRICNETHPELDVSTISLADIIMRANPAKKGNKKLKKIKKLKKYREEKSKVKKKHGPALPPLTQQDVYRIKHESLARQPLPVYEKEEVIIEEKVDEHFELSSGNEEEEDAKCFFMLLKSYFTEQSNMIRSESELIEKVSIWENSNAASTLPWTKQQPGWSHLVPEAMNFLAGRGNSLPDFVSLVSYMEETNEWKWTGDAKDINERFLLPLCNIWLSTLHNQNEDVSVIVEEEPQEQIQNANHLKTDFVVRPSTDQERTAFQLQEKKRYENPQKPFIYKMHGFSSIVGPVKGVFNKDTGSSKAREHALLISNRPAYVTILSLVRDAVARLPNGEGTRAEVCQLLKDSSFINPEASDAQVHAVVSGALDRLHAEKDPCVKYDTTRKLWVYLHRVRSVQEFERIHQASAAAAMAKKQMNQKQKTSSKKRPAQDSVEMVDDTVVKLKSKASKKSGDKPKKKRSRNLSPSVTPAGTQNSFEQAETTGSPTAGPRHATTTTYHSEFSLPREEAGIPTDISGQFPHPNRLPYFATQPAPAKPDHGLSNAVPLKITLPRGSIGSFSPSAMSLQIQKSSTVVGSGHRKGGSMLVADHDDDDDEDGDDDDDDLNTIEHGDESASEQQLIIDHHDSSEFLPRIDSSFDDDDDAF